MRRLPLRSSTPCAVLLLLTSSWLDTATVTSCFRSVHLRLHRHPAKKAPPSQFRENRWNQRSQQAPPSSPPVLAGRPREVVALFFASSDDGGDTIVPWRLENDFDTFLTQCSLQSFLFLLQSLRDANSARWLDDFAQPAIPDPAPAPEVAQQQRLPSPRAPGDCKLLHYHGLAAFNATIFPAWDAFFGQLLEQPPASYTIVSDRPYVPDYELEIVPASLCSRLLSVREQVAREFVKDLHVISTAFGPEAYYNRGRGRGGSGRRWGTAPHRHDGSDNDGSLLFLDQPADENAIEPSPLRRGNFDLLLLLCTQEGVHRALQLPGLDPATRDCLQNFYVERLFSHFAGNQPYGRADDFLEELLWDAPRRVLRHPSSHDGGGGDGGFSDPDLALFTLTKLVDPRRLASLVLEQRQVVASEWRARALEVPAEHLAIKRMQLNLLMGRPANQTSAAWG